MNLCVCTSRCAAPTACSVMRVFIGMGACVCVCMYIPAHLYVFMEGSNWVVQNRAQHRREPAGVIEGWAVCLWEPEAQNKAMGGGGLRNNGRDREREKAMERARETDTPVLTRRWETTPFGRCISCTEQEGDGCWRMQQAFSTMSVEWNGKVEGAFHLCCVCFNCNKESNS